MDGKNRFQAVFELVSFRAKFDILWVKVVFTNCGIFTWLPATLSHKVNPFFAYLRVIEGKLEG